MILRCLTSFSSAQCGEIFGVEREGPDEATRLREREDVLGGVIAVLALR